MTTTIIDLARLDWTLRNRNLPIVRNDGVRVGFAQISSFGKGAISASMRFMAKLIPPRQRFGLALRMLKSDDETYPQDIAIVDEGENTCYRWSLFYGGDVAWTMTEAQFHKAVVVNPAGDVLAYDDPSCPVSVFAKAKTSRKKPAPKAMP